MPEDRSSHRPPRQRSLLASLAALASVPLHRPGTALPGRSAPFAAAPDASAGNPRPSPARRLRISLRAAIAEGMFAEVVGACSSGVVLMGWAIHLGCSPLMIGLLGTLPFLGQAIQLPSAYLAARVGHRKLALIAVAASRQALLPLALLPMLSLSPAGQERLLLVVSAASALLGVVGNNAWVSWMGDLVPKRVRGRYFGSRTALCTLAGTLASLAAGVVLDRAAQTESTGLALAALAGIACLAGAVTTFLMSRQHEPAHPKGVVPVRPDFSASLAPLRDVQVRRYLTYQIAWNASIGVSAVYFTLHMLQNLKMGFTLMALQSAVIAGGQMLWGPWWGRVIDRIGARPVLIACSFGISLLPLVWLFATPDFLWPILLVVLASPLLWSGHAQASFNLPLNLAPRAGRSFYLATFAMGGGLAYSAATFAGGALAEQLPHTFVLLGQPFFGLQLLFVLSFAARMGAGLLGLRIVEQGARPVEDLARLVRSSASELTSRVGRLASPVLRR